MGDQLERLAEAGALLGRERQRVVAAVVDDPLALPHLVADVDDLARPAERRLVGHAVEALDHLRARRAQAEDAAAVAHRVDAGGGHGDERRRARVDRQDGRADLDRLGGGGQVAHEAGRVVAVGLGHPYDVESGRLVVAHLRGRLLEPTGVGHLHRQLHAALPSPPADLRAASCASACSRSAARAASRSVRRASASTTRACSAATAAVVRSPALEHAALGAVVEAHAVAHPREPVDEQHLAGRAGRHPRQVVRGRHLLVLRKDGGVTSSGHAGAPSGRIRREDQAVVWRASAQVRPTSTSTSWGRPSTRSATMLRCTSPVPPPMVRAWENSQP